MSSIGCRVSLAECARLLGSVSVGRLVYVEDAVPALLPVSFAAMAGEIVVPTDDEWFDRVDGHVVAFEAGEVDPITRVGWSVVAVGHARHLTYADGVVRVHGDSGGAVADPSW